MNSAVHILICTEFGFNDGSCFLRWCVKIVAESYNLKEQELIFILMIKFDIKWADQFSMNVKERIDTQFAL
jgi:hypothetical protein